MKYKSMSKSQLADAAGVSRKTFSEWLVPFREDLRHIPIKDHPYYAIKDCVPMPFNWNGTDHLKSMMENFKMVSAKYYNRYGIYTLKAAQAFQLTDIKPLNFK